MVGLSIVLETPKSSTSSSNQKTPQVINKKITMNKSPPTSSSSSSTFPAHPSGFLDQCFLCKKKLLPSKDIYMYKGDRAFCSVECRCRQIDMDEEETAAASFKRNKNNNNNCSLASSSSSSSSSPPRNRKGTRNQANGFATY